MDDQLLFVYRIQVRGKLDARWADWFDGMAISTEVGEDGLPLTTLVGPVEDQSQLRGVLTRIWNLNLTLVSVTLLDQGASAQGTSGTME
jgi:hypothetical protein